MTQNNREIDFFIDALLYYQNSDFEYSLCEKVVKLTWSGPYKL